MQEFVPSAQSAENVCMTKRRPLASRDLAIRTLVQSALEPYGPGSGTLEVAWGEDAGMWFVEVTPSQPDAASLSVAYDGYGAVSVVIGNSWFEMFPVDDGMLHDLRQIVDATFAGRLEEVGSDYNGTVRIRVADGTTLTAGAWAPGSSESTRVRKYEAYRLPCL